MSDERVDSRRAFLGGMLAVPVVVLSGAGARALRGGIALDPTPACAEPHDLTPSETAGPYFRPRSPERTSLIERGTPGTRLVVSGVVLSTRCQPVPRALLDFWHADDGGEYDLSGYGFRGHQFADAAGRFTLETIVPGLYGGRTRHIHVKVQAPDAPVLTTQLYFPGEEHNRSDGLYRPELEVALREEGGPRRARFDFVVRT
jgi:protocatechuate 3,4-dioxygenase beta subunit